MGLFYFMAVRKFFITDNEFENEYIECTSSFHLISVDIFKNDRIKHTFYFDADTAEEFIKEMSKVINISIKNLNNFKNKQNEE